MFELRRYFYFKAYFKSSKIKTSKCLYEIFLDSYKETLSGRVGAGAVSVQAGGSQYDLARAWRSRLRIARNALLCVKEEGPAFKEGFSIFFYLNLKSIK